MKNIMVYSKYKRFDIIEFFTKLKENSSKIYFFSLFFCGLTAGAILGINAFNLSLNESVASVIVLPLIIFITAFLCGFSCFGVPILFFIPVLTGINYGLFFYSNISSDNFYEYLSFLVPEISSAILISLSLLLMCETAQKISAETASVIILKKANTIMVKSYLIYSGILFAFFSAGLILKIVLIK